MLRVSEILQLGMQEDQILLRASAFTITGLKVQRGGGLQTASASACLPPSSTSLSPLRRAERKAWLPGLGWAVIRHIPARGVKGRDADSSPHGPSWFNMSSRKAPSLSRRSPHQQHFLYHNPVFYLGFSREQDEQEKKKRESTWTKTDGHMFSC